MNTEKLLELKAWAQEESAKKDRDEPSEWLQSYWIQKSSSWVCGTTCCLAGKTALSEGWEPEWYANRSLTAGVVKDGKSQPVSDVAQEILGLSDYEADVLFSGGNDLADVERIIDQLVAGLTPTTWQQEAGLDDE